MALNIDQIRAIADRVAASGLAATILPMSAVTGVDESSKLTMLRLIDPGISRTVALCRATDQPNVGAMAAVAPLATQEMRQLVETGVWAGSTLVEP